MADIIEVKNLTLHYNDILIFKDISFSISSKDFITIMGANGSGKSLLAHVLIGLISYDGSVKLMGEEVKKIDRDIIMSKISFIMDDYDNYYLEKNVVSEFMDINVNSKLLKSIIRELELQNLLERDPRTLSVGEKQLINIACAILEQKPIIILDNALSMIDQNKKKKVFNLLKRINEKGTIIINVTQDSEDILYSKRVIVLNDNKMIIDDSIKNALMKEKEFSNAHINLPFIAELCIKLKYYNIISKIELDSVKLVNNIWK